MSEPASPNHPPLRSFGRIKSRAVKPRQAALFGALLPSIRMPDPKAGPIDPAALMPGAAEVWLEIGFGGGEHMAAQAGRRPDVLVIGAEPFVNGVASALRHVDEGGLKNVRLHPDDGRDVVAALPGACIDRVFILFPDPWQKARHNKRRLLQPAFLAELMRVLKPGGRLRFVTDWQDYADQSRDLLDATDGLTRVPDVGGDPEDRTAPADHVVTRYEEKKLGDCAPVFLDYVRG
jgi:tRNA (guanine-N7-)-methyltransferase